MNTGIVKSKASGLALMGAETDLPQNTGFGISAGLNYGGQLFLVYVKHLQDKLLKVRL